MANKRLSELDALGLLQSGASLYVLQNETSYRVDIDQISDVLVNEYAHLTINLPANLMTIANADMILDGLNYAEGAMLESGRIQTGAFATFKMLEATGTWLVDNAISGDIDGGAIV